MSPHLKTVSLAVRYITDTMTNPFPFGNDRELLGVLEELFDTLSFPCRFDNYRCFYDKKRPSPVKKGKRCGNMSEKNKATFIIHVQFRRNATWQGTIQWVESQKQQSFRSTLEMLRLIDEALEDGSEAHDSVGNDRRCRDRISGSAT